MLIGVVGVDFRQNLGRSIYPEVLGQGGEVQIVAGLIAAHDEERLDAQSLLDGWHVTWAPEGRLHRMPTSRAGPCAQMRSA